MSCTHQNPGPLPHTIVVYLALALGCLHCVAPYILLEALLQLRRRGRHYRPVKSVYRHAVVLLAALLHFRPAFSCSELA